MRRAALAAAIAACALPAAAAPAQAVERSSGEVRALAARAGEESSALTALRDTDRVDGRPADLGAALTRVRGAQLETRLAALAAAPAAGTGPTEPRAAERDAKEILREKRFAGAEAGGSSATLGERVTGWFIDVFNDLDDRLPGGAGVVFALLALVALVVGGVLASRVSARVQLIPGTRLGHMRSRAVDPAALEREAADAEVAGDYATGVRLRMAAGLLRLDAAEAIRLRPSLTTGQVGRTLASADFDALAGTFDQVAYGGRPGEPADAEAARERWPKVLEEAGA